MRELFLSKKGGTAWNDLLLPLPSVLYHGADDEVVGDGRDDGHGDVGDGVLQAHHFDEEQHQAHPHNKEVEHVGADDADKVEGCRLRLEGPIDGQQVVDTKRDEIAGDEGHLVGREEAHHVEDGRVDDGAGAAYNAETDELSRFLVAKQFLYLLDH